MPQRGNSEPYDEFERLSGMHGVAQFERAIAEARDDLELAYLQKRTGWVRVNIKVHEGQVVQAQVIFDRSIPDRTA